jgi:hypothetical protein
MNISYNNVKINQITETRFLGVLVDVRLTARQHTADNNLTVRINEVTGMLRMYKQLVYHHQTTYDTAL